MQRERNPAFFKPSGGAGAASSSSKRPTAVAAALRRARASGRLTISQLTLTGIPPDVFRPADALEADEKWWECVPLTALDASMNEITALPPDIATLAETLQILKVCHNRLPDLPPEVCSLSALKVLDVSNNALTVLPAAIGSLVCLVEMTANDNRLTRVPDSLCELTALEILKLDKNNISSLPPALGLCSRLRDLTVSENVLVTLPDTVGRLGRLKLLEIRKNKLTALPPSISGLTSLTLLDLRENELSALPTLPATTTLEQLFVGFNNLRRVDWGGLGAASCLAVLDVSSNKLTTVEDSVFALQRLHTLDISNNDIGGNPLRTIRRGLLSGAAEPLMKYLRSRAADPTAYGGMAAEGAVVSMVAAGAADKWRVQRRDAAASGVLDLTGLKFSEIPTEGLLADEAVLSRVRQIVASKNTLSSLPDIMRGCEALLTLDLSYNSFKVFPAILTGLSLTTCVLCGNSISSASISEALLGSSGSFPLARSLTSLDLSQNGLKTIPAGLGRLYGLRSLSLASNGVSSAGEEDPLRRLCALTALDLSGNKLTAVPPSVLRLPELETLNIENNDISEIPVALSAMATLRTLLIAGNPQRMIRQAVVSQGSGAVLKFLADRIVTGPV